MPATLIVRDENAFAHSLSRAPNAFELDLPSERVTARELIQARVEQEVQDYNDRQPEVFNFLVQPADAERTLNGFRLPKRRWIDPEKQAERAVEAFLGNGFILLVDDRQVDDLEQIIEVKPQTAVTFLKLVPLVGG